MPRPVMFSSKLEHRRKVNRWALVVAMTVLVVGIAAIAFWTVRAFDMLGTVEADRTPVIMSVLIASAGLIVLCIAAYIAVRIVGRMRMEQ